MKLSLSVRIVEAACKTRLHLPFEQLASIARDARYHAICMRASAGGVQSTSEQLAQIQRQAEQVGLPVAMVTAGGLAQPVLGKIVRIDPTADLKTRAFKVEVEVSNPDEHLRPGMIATVDFRQKSETSQLIIPQHFLVTKLDANGVFVAAKDDVARWRPLELGSVVRDQVVIKSGLKVGDRVVSLGQRGLVDGDQLIC